MLKRNRAEWDRITRRILKCQRRRKSGYVPADPVTDREPESSRLLRLLDSLFLDHSKED
jgi:hypothetical protein